MSDASRNPFAMSSRERVLNTVDRRPADHVPLLMRFWPMGGEDRLPFPWRDQVKRAEFLLSQGIDDTLVLQPPLGYIEEYDAGKVPEVRISLSTLPADGANRYAALVKEYTTPEGTLRHVVNLTEDWACGGDIPLFSDYNVPRAREHAVKTREDVRRLRYLLNEPDAEQTEQFRQNARSLRAEARRLGVALEGGWTALGDAAVDLCGMERILLAQMDEPEFLGELLDALLEWELKRADALLGQGVDMLVHMAWYEGTDFWTPANWRSLVKPRLKRLIGAAHAKGARFRYIITKAWSPLLEDLMEIGVDCISGADPVQDRLDLRDVCDRAAGRVCLMGGVNSAVMLEQWDDGQIKEAVDEALDVFGSGGFILYPVDAVFSDMDWGRAEVLIRRWKERCGLLKNKDRGIEYEQ